MTSIPIKTATHPHVEILRTIYADLPRVADYAAESIILHRADRSAEDPRVVRGVPAVLAHEQALLRLTGNTLVMDAEDVVANDQFGAVLGVLHATQPRQLDMAFCGLWRFEGGRIVEHWENAHDPAMLQQLFTSSAPSLPAP